MTAWVLPLLYQDPSGTGTAEGHSDAVLLNEKNIKCIYIVQVPQTLTRIMALRDIHMKLS